MPLSLQEPPEQILATVNYYTEMADKRHAMGDYDAADVYRDAAKREARKLS